MRIKTSIAKKLVNNYRQNHWPVINGSCPSLHQNPNFPNVQDSLSVWFNLNSLKQFISDIEGQADGIRIYFGEYSNDVIQDMLNEPATSANPATAANLPNIPQYCGLHTLVMIPTRPTTAGISCDYNPDGPDFSNPDDLCAENHGTMNPPPFYNATNSSTQTELNNGQIFMLFCDQNP